MFPRTDSAALLKSGPFAFPSESHADSVRSLFWPEGSQRSQSRSELQEWIISQLFPVIVLCRKLSSARERSRGSRAAFWSSVPGCLLWCTHPREFQLLGPPRAPVSVPLTLPKSAVGPRPRRSSGVASGWSAWLASRFSGSQL